MVKRIIRPITVSGDLAYVPLTQGLVSVIDASDVALAEGRNWYAKRIGPDVYACSNQKPLRPALLSLHRVILGVAAGQMVDHIDRDTLNNRRSNLRSASCSENNCNRRTQSNNRSGFKGVSWDARRGLWRAVIMKSRRQIYLGSFSSIEEAAAAYAEAVPTVHGGYGSIA